MRNIDTNLAAGLAAPSIAPFFAAELQFKSSIQRVWTGTGTITFNGHDFAGIGSLAGVGTISEGSDVSAMGTSVVLSGIDPALLGESLNDIQPGLQAIVWLGLLQNGIVLSVYSCFSGIIDAPSIHVGTDTISITLNLESRMIDFQRASGRRLTSADQRSRFPHDSGFDWVETLNDFTGIWK